MRNDHQEPPEPLEGPDFVLLLLDAQDPSGARGQLTGVTRLEKMLFLAEQEKRVSRFVDEPFLFKPYHYGPYSKEVYEAVELLEGAGLVQEERLLHGHVLDELEEMEAALSESEGVERRFVLTNDGEAIAGYLADLHPELRNALTDIRKKYGGMSLRALIRYVYQTYPEFAAASRIRDEVM